MEWQVLFNWMGGILSGVILWLFKSQREDLLKVRERTHTLANEVHRTQLYANQQFAAKEEVRELRAEIRQVNDNLNAQFRELFDRLDRKVDK